MKQSRSSHSVLLSSSNSLIYIEATSYMNEYNGVEFVGVS